MSKDPELQQKLSLIVSKSVESLNVARFLYSRKYFDDAASKSYYAVFHCLQAALLTRNLSFSKHSGVMGGFNREFVLRGTFPDDFREKIKRLFEDRQVGDYGYKERISKAKAERDIEDAETIVKTVTEYLRKEGFLGPETGSSE